MKRGNPRQIYGNADIVLTGGEVLNVYSGELLSANVVVSGERIRYVGPGGDEYVSQDTLVLDVKDKVLVPGYIEPHCHPWNLYNPVSLGEEACRSGTTCLFCDNLIHYMLMGLERFEAFMDEVSLMPITFRWCCRSMPQTPMDQEEQLFSTRNIIRLIENPLVQSIAEITRWPQIAGQPPARIRAMIRAAKRIRKRVDGHTAGARYDELNALSLAGVDSCHESITGEEALDRLRLGMYVMLRESSLRRDLPKLLKVLKESGVLTNRLLLTTDGSTPAFYSKYGFTDHLIRIAIREGIHPGLAYRMATLNPAVYFGLDHEIGGIAPGRQADILVLENLLSPTPHQVIARGAVAVEKGTLTSPFPLVEWGKFISSDAFSRGEWEAKSDFFEIHCKEKSLVFPTVKLVSAVITRTEWVEFDCTNGVLDLEARPGFHHVALLSRDGRWITNGILEGFGNGIEALVSSFNTATEILAIGRDTSAIRIAVDRVREMGGGIVAIEDGKSAFELPLPLGGVMAKESVNELAEKEKALHRFLKNRGYPFHDPLFTLIFLPNDFLPDVRVNFRGIVEIKDNRVLWPRRDLH